MCLSEPFALDQNPKIQNTEYDNIKMKLGEGKGSPSKCRSVWHNHVKKPLTCKLKNRKQQVKVAGQGEKKEM